MKFTQPVDGRWKAVNHPLGNGQKGCLGMHFMGGQCRSPHRDRPSDANSAFQRMGGNVPAWIECVEEPEGMEAGKA